MAALPMRHADPQVGTNEWGDSIVRKDLSIIAKDLQDWLTQRLVGYIVGLSDARDIGRYARKETTPHSIRAKRLRDLYMLVLEMKEKEDDRTIQAWFVGTNLFLGENAPAKVLRNNFELRFSEVRKAVRKFLAG